MTDHSGKDAYHWQRPAQPPTAQDCRDLMELRVREANVAALAEARLEDLPPEDRKHAVLMTGRQLAALIPGLVSRPEGELPVDIDALDDAQDLIMETLGYSPERRQQHEH